MLRLQVIAEQAEPGKIKPRRDRAANQGEIAQSARRLPGVRHHRTLRHLPGRHRAKSLMPNGLIRLLGNQQLKRCAFIEVPQFIGIHPVPSADSTGRQQKHNRGAAQPAIRRCLRRLKQAAE